MVWSTTAAPLIRHSSSRYQKSGGAPLVSLFAATAALLVGAVGQVQQPVQSPTTPSLVVTGSSEVRVTPDLATLSIGVTTQAKTANEAQNEANKRTSDFLDQ